MSQKENPMQKIIAKCWEDEEFKNRLMADPNAVLCAEGIIIPDGVTVKVVMDTKQVQHLIIPSHELSETSLRSVVGGGGHSSAIPSGTLGLRPS